MPTKLRHMSADAGFRQCEAAPGWNVSRIPSLALRACVATCLARVGRQEWRHISRLVFPPLHDVRVVAMRWSLKFSLLFALLLGTATLAVSAEGDLPKLPLGLKPVPIPADNPLTAEKVALGKQL